LTKGQLYSNKKLDFRLELEFDRNLNWIYLNLIQIQDYNMINTWLHELDSGMLQSSPPLK
jgi:hypothetical protein